MLVLVSTERARIFVVVGAGLGIFGALWLLRGALTGVPSFVAGVAAILTVSLVTAYLVATAVEGRIDHRARRRLMQRLPSLSGAEITTRGRCTHCRRPLVVVKGVSLCAACDRRR